MIWLGEEGSNLRPPDSESEALPAKLSPNDEGYIALIKTCVKGTF